MLTPFKKPIGIISMSGSHWPHRVVPGLLGHESLCWALGHTKNHNCPQHTGALLSAGEALTVAGTPCAHTGTPCPPGHTHRKASTVPYHTEPPAWGSACLMRATTTPITNDHLTSGNLGPREDVRL